jgi:cytochrome c oxidase cbb3-type subunit 4
MDTYSLFRQIADSWVLLGMFGFFIGCILWAFRPGSRALHDEAAAIVLRSDDARETAEAGTTGPRHE